MDEVVMLRTIFEDTPIQVTDTDNTQTARDILGADPALRLVLLDNGLQHLPLLRDFDILAVNALEPFGNGHLPPRGTLREPSRAALKRTDAVVLHHTDLAGPRGVADSMAKLGPMLPKHALVTQSRMTPSALRCVLPPQRSLDMSDWQGLGDDVGVERLKGAAVVCLTGVGSPFTVEAHLRQLGALYVEGCGAHEDHHMFSVEEVDAAVRRVRQLAGDPAFSHACILLTDKDYYRQAQIWSSVLSRYASELSNGSIGGSGSGSGSGGSSDSGEQKLTPPRWGAYVLHSELQIVEHDRRFSSHKAVLGAVLRLSIDNFRRRRIME